MAKSQIGLIGLGTMGAMLALNIAENGFTISVYNRTASVTDEFHKNAGDLRDKITANQSLEAFVSSLATPRAIILMVPAGDVVDAQIAALRPLLDKEDLIIDAGNANYNDTEQRAAEAEAAGVPFLGIGVSGGAEGARFGPSIMGGGKREGWDRVSDVLAAISAKYEGPKWLLRMMLKPASPCSISFWIARARKAQGAGLRWRRSTLPRPFP